MEEPGDKESANEIKCGVDDPPAQLGEMLQQAHAGEFRALCDGRARAVDEVNHGGGTRWERWIPLAPHS